MTSIPFPAETAERLVPGISDATADYAERMLHVYQSLPRDLSLRPSSSSGFMPRDPDLAFLGSGDSYKFKYASDRKRSKVRRTQPALYNMIDILHEDSFDDFALFAQRTGSLVTEEAVSAAEWLTGAVAAFAGVHIQITHHKFPDRLTWSPKGSWHASGLKLVTISATAGDRASERLKDLHKRLRVDGSGTVIDDNSEAEGVITTFNSGPLSAKYLEHIQWPMKTLSAVAEFERRRRRLLRTDLSSSAGGLPVQEEFFEKDRMPNFATIKENASVKGLLADLVRGAFVTVTVQGKPVKVELPTLRKDTAKCLAAALVGHQGELSQLVERAQLLKDHLSEVCRSTFNPQAEALRYLGTNFELLRRVASGGVDSTPKIWASLVRE